MAACAAPPPRARIVLPTLQLAPASLGRTLALQQRLDFAFGPERRALDALLEVDAQRVSLAVQALGRSGVTLSWDGVTLAQTRADWLPAAVRGERVLDDLQFVYWPLDAIRAALPPGWQVDGEGGTRNLRHDGTVWLAARMADDGTVTLENHADGYRLTVRSVSLDAAAAHRVEPTMPAPTRERAA
nr:DUF3261 domain-containing protein [Chiayiivirga flava]